MGWGHALLDAFVLYLKFVAVFMVYTMSKNHAALKRSKRNPPILEKCFFYFPFLVIIGFLSLGFSATHIDDEIKLQMGKVACIVLGTSLLMGLHDGLKMSDDDERKIRRYSNMPSGD
jgi:predicted metallopeptidase